MLHNNDSASWTPFAGSETNEGTTEYLTIKAVEAEGYTASHSYPDQEGVVQKLVGVVGEETLMNAYFKGKTAALKKAMENACKGTRAEFKKAMQAEQWAKARSSWTRSRCRVLRAYCPWATPPSSAASDRKLR